MKNFVEKTRILHIYELEKTRKNKRIEGLENHDKIFKIVKRRSYRTSSVNILLYNSNNPNNNHRRSPFTCFMLQEPLGKMRGGKMMMDVVLEVWIRLMVTHLEDMLITDSPYSTFYLILFGMFVYIIRLESRIKNQSTKNSVQNKDESQDIE
jgi:hypothetical protein